MPTATPHTLAVPAFSRDGVMPLMRGLLVALAAVALSSCGSDNPDTVNHQTLPDGSSRIALDSPPEFLSRMVNIETLQLSVTLDGEPQTATRQGNSFSARIQLLDDDNHVLLVRWTDTANNRTFPLAESDPITLNRSTQNTSITIDNYNHLQFDQDNDAISNLDEVRLNRDPFVADAPSPNANQGQCRTADLSNQLPGFYVADVVPVFQNPLVIASSRELTNITPSVATGNLVAFESFWVLRSGRLTVDHQDMGPNSTGALLYDVDTAGTVRRLAEDIAIQNGVSVSRRATFSVPLQAGLYCYRLESTITAETVGTPRLRYVFEPDPF